MRVLLAHSSSDLFEALERFLKEQSIAVEKATSTNQAYVMSLLNCYDVLLLEYEILDMGSFELCYKLRDQSVKTPIMMMFSDSFSVSLHKEALDLGADVCFSLISDFQLFLSQMRALARRKDHLKMPIFESMGVFIDCNRMLLTRGKKSLRLSPKEFRVLEYLAKHQGTVLTRNQVLENVWGSEGHMMSNVIDVHMSRLRKKIYDFFGVSLVQTIRGQGYLLSTDDSL